ncbi:hypothetical protein ASZ78_000147 [Callipepla squamata]|uniref:Thioredoxin-dependent peroxide reductase, mitochondrial n=1 Tax=Callipepla squamata TaxID=9009 RepID=A0A226NAA5_CALSU|nr:hypothetical protein ASZ78_000147 [Callipepla squamata]
MRDRAVDSDVQSQLVAEIILLLSGLIYYDLQEKRREEKRREEKRREEKRREEKRREEKRREEKRREEKRTSCAPRLGPAVTQHAPFFKGTAVVNGEFKELTLDDFKGKYLVLFFYPLDFTFVCPTEIVAFSNKANEFHDVNCEVVAVSVDSHFCHLAWINTPRKSGGLGKMNIPVLSDLTKQISRDYGVLLEGPGIALRGLFIIDPNGVIKHLSVNDLPVGRSVEETLRLVKAFQYVETHGEVCPANWTPDSPTVRAC